MLTQMFSNDYKAKKTSFFMIARTHLKGWSYSDWSILGIQMPIEKIIFPLATTVRFTL